MNKKEYLYKGLKYIQEETKLRIRADEFYILVNEFEENLGESVSDIEIITGVMKGIGSELQLIYKFAFPSSEHQKLMKSFLEYQEVYPFEYGEEKIND